MKNSDTLTKLISIMIIGSICFYIASHISAAILTNTNDQNILAVLAEHIRTAPLDLLYFHPIVYIYALGIWAVGSITVLCMRPSPKADMKGIEKGSNDFMTDKELKEFIKNNTTRCR